MIFSSQARKRKRVNEICSEKNCRISQTEEFSISILLGHNSILYQYEEEKEECSYGSNKLCMLVEFLDSRDIFNHHNSAESSSQTSSSSKACVSKSTQIQDLLPSLRQAVTRLLLLEVTSTKFYKGACYAYFVLLCKKLDHYIFLPASSSNSSSSNSSSSNSSSLANMSSVWTKEILESAVTVLDKYSARTERGMYKIPENGELVPKIFSKAMEVVRINDARQSMLEEDGLELVEATIKDKDINVDKKGSYRNEPRAWYLSSDEESIDWPAASDNNSDDDYDDY
jgi:hypothetical protein